MVEKLDTKLHGLPVPDMPERVLLDLHGRCNLKCPMCLVHGLGDEKAKQEAIGTMPMKSAMAILDEVAESKPLIHPELYGEPTLTPNFAMYMAEIKHRGMGVAINTNGLTLNKDFAKLFVDLKVDSVFVSIDAATPETLKVIRGVLKLDKIKRNVEMLLEARGDDISPRIGVSFALQQENECEVDEFVDFWIKKVDVVRVGGVYADGRVYGLATPTERVPCKMLYQSMPIHFNGDALLCCLDGLAKNVMGNVFEDGVHAVWHGEKYSAARHYHETGQWDKVPYCKNCSAWAGGVYEEEIRGDILIRRSPQFVYYNRMDRLKSWQDGVLRGHEKPR